MHHDTFRTLAWQKGFSSKTLRSQAWQTMLSIEPQMSLSYDPLIDATFVSLKTPDSLVYFSYFIFGGLTCRLVENEVVYADKNQVVLDIMRSFVHFEGFQKRSIHRYRRKLERVLAFVFSRNPSLHYYQGFHDICSVLVVILDEWTACLAAERLAIYYLKDFMASSMDAVLPYLNFVYYLLEHSDPSLYECLVSAGMPPYFCLSWIITWFSHDLRELSYVDRLFDCILSTHPFLPLYLSAAMVMVHRDTLMQLTSEDLMNGKLYQILPKLPLHTNLSILLEQCEHVFQLSSFSMTRSLPLVSTFSPLSESYKRSKQWFLLMQTASALQREKRIQSYRLAINRQGEKRHRKHIFRLGWMVILIIFPLMIIFLLWAFMFQLNLDIMTLFYYKWI